MLRKAADGMVAKPDPKAERKRQRKAEKAALRAANRTEGIVGMVRLFLTGKPAELPPEECPDCQALTSLAKAA